MNSPAFRYGILLGAVLLAAALWANKFRSPAVPPSLSPDLEEREPDGRENRIRFVCCNDDGHYSPVVYMRVGGGQAAFRTVREAARFLRPGDPDAAAAGLCGYLFMMSAYGGDTGGTLSLEAAPKVEADGTVDWVAVGGDADVVLINVTRGTAKGCFGAVQGTEIRDLHFGTFQPLRPRGGHRMRHPI